MLPYSIEARHPEDGTDRGANDVRRKAGRGKGRRQRCAVKMVEMSRRVQRKPPAAEQCKLKTADIRNVDDEKAVVFEQPMDPPQGINRAGNVLERMTHEHDIERAGSKRR